MSHWGITFVVDSPRPYRRKRIYERKNLNFCFPPWFPCTLNLDFNSSHFTSLNYQLPIMTDTTPQPVPTVEEDTHFILPDLVSHCKFPLVYHPQGDEIANQSVTWLDTNCPDLNPKQRQALYGLQAGELTAFCYPYCTPERLRIVSDFMNYLFHLDNISDGMMTKDTDLLSDAVMNALWHSDRYMPTSTPGKEQPADEINAGKLAREYVHFCLLEELMLTHLSSYWSRCIPDAGPGMQARFKETVEMFFEAVNTQARARDSGIILDLEAYIDVRRDTSGCKPVFDLIEYAMDMDLPEYVVTHPVVKALNQGTNDLVTWSNVRVIFSQSLLSQC
jgi:hypothetical protein